MSLRVHREGVARHEAYRRGAVLRSICPFFLGDSVDILRFLRHLEAKKRLLEAF